MGLSLRPFRHAPAPVAPNDAPPPAGSHSTEPRRVAELAKKIGAAVAAAALVPSVVLGATHQGATTPPAAPKGPTVVRVVDGPGATTLDLQIRALERSGSGSITRQLAGVPVELKISAADVARLSPEQRGAHRLLVALFEAVEPAQDSLTALRTLTGQKNTEAPLVIDRAVIVRTAANLRAVGLPLTKDGMAAFARQRSLGALGDPALAARYADALAGHELVVNHSAHPSAAERGAAAVYAALGPKAAAELQKELGASGPKGALLLQATKLHDQVVTKSALDRLTSAASLRGLSLAPAGIAALREAHGLGSSAEITPKTAQVVAKLVTTVGTRPKGEQARAAWYRVIVESQGHAWRTGVNEVNIVGLRGYDVAGHEVPNAFNRWNDTVAFVWKNSHGKWEVREFRATTDPGMKSYWDSPDVNGDGSGDVADLRPGQYPYYLGTHHGYYGAGNPGYNLPVWRDTNHDGRIETREKQASARRDDRGTGINIHWGPGAGAPEVGMYSLGCQVLQIDRYTFQSQVTPLFELNRGGMKYTLVNMATVA